jgi:ubiquinone/menaquinone biosynthesis C-methylase UbiE
MKKQKDYREYAEYYDLIYSAKDYATRARLIKKEIKNNKKSKGKEFLEVACGTGKYLEYFKNSFNCTGLDINEHMLKIAKKKYPNINFVKGNMINFNLRKEFDVVACLFSSIGYVQTYSNLKKTISNFTKHLKSGGLMVIEPWFDKSNFKVGKISMNTYDGKDIKIARMVASKKKGDMSIMDFHYLILEKGKEPRHIVGRHNMGLFSKEKTIEIMKKVGLRVKYLDKERGLFIGVKKIK